MNVLFALLMSLVMFSVTWVGLTPVKLAGVCAKCGSKREHDISYFDAVAEARRVDGDNCLRRIPCRECGESVAMALVL